MNAAGGEYKTKGGKNESRRRERVMGREEETRGEDGETEEGSARQLVASGVPPWETCS